MHTVTCSSLRFRTLSLHNDATLNRIINQDSSAQTARLHAPTTQQHLQNADKAGRAYSSSTPAPGVAEVAGNLHKLRQKNKKAQTRLGWKMAPYFSIL